MSKAVICFRGMDECHKTVAAQIPHDARLAPIPFTGRKSLPTSDQNSTIPYSTSSKHCDLNLVTMTPQQWIS